MITCCRWSLYTIIQPCCLTCQRNRQLGRMGAESCGALQWSRIRCNAVKPSLNHSLWHDPTVEPRSHRSPASTLCGSLGIPIRSWILNDFALSFIHSLALRVIAKPIALLRTRTKRTCVLLPRRYHDRGKAKSELGRFFWEAVSRAWHQYPYLDVVRASRYFSFKSIWNSDSTELSRKHRTKRYIHGKSMSKTIWTAK